MDPALPAAFSVQRFASVGDPGSQGRPRVVFQPGIGEPELNKGGTGSPMDPVPPGYEGLFR